MSEEKIKHFVRVANTDLEGRKNIVYALTKINGINYSFANAICVALDIDKNKKAGLLPDSDVKRLNEFIKNPKIPSWLFNRKRDSSTGEDKHLVTSELKLTKDFDIKSAKKIKSYVGMRHAYGLPVRGQRTRSNFRKGTTVGVIKGKIKRGVV